MAPNNPSPPNRIAVGPLAGFRQRTPKRIPPFPCRVEGWLNICGESTLDAVSMRRANSLRSPMVAQLLRRLRLDDAVRRISN